MPKKKPPTFIEKLARDLRPGDRVLDEDSDDHLLTVGTIRKGFIHFTMEDGSKDSSVFIEWKGEPDGEDWSQLPSREPVQVAA